jgi:hypothetical protein
LQPQNIIVTRTQLDTFNFRYEESWYGYVERMEPTGLPKIMSTGNLKGRNEAVPGESGKMEYIQP